MVGEQEGDPNVVMTHRMSSEILAKGIPHAEFVTPPLRKTTTSPATPEEVHWVTREFLRE